MARRECSVKKRYKSLRNNKVCKLERCNLWFGCLDDFEFRRLNRGGIVMRVMMELETPIWAGEVERKDRK